ncbi:C40 family peptidase [Brevibacillus fluminis]|nr:C40 family peptidase [Brevibacillus fluminis]
MKKPGWKMGSVFALLMCTSLAFGGQANAASLDSVKSGADASVSVTAAKSSAGAKVIKAGEKYMGTPYKYASSRSDKSTMDCSEFTMWAFREGAGIDLGRGGARSQYKKVKHISRSQLKVGDLIFFSTRATMKYNKNSINRIGHVGIYAGNNKILHTYGQGGVRYSTLTGWWDQHFVAAGRVLN